MIFLRKYERTGNVSHIFLYKCSICSPLIFYGTLINKGRNKKRAFVWNVDNIHTKNQFINNKDLKVLTF